MGEIWRGRNARNPEGSLQQAVRRLRNAGLRKAMEAEVDRVRRVIRENGTLAEARAAMAGFTSEWLPDEG